MSRSHAIGLLAAAVAGWMVLAGAPARAGDTAAVPYAKCARACADCQLACDACFRHCTELTAGGAKEHAHTLQLCFACGDFCSLAAKLAAARNPLAPQACEACAKACDECGSACGKFPDQPTMVECAKSCRDCALACREMIEHLNK